MEVTINEAGFRALFEAPEGPLAREIENRAQEIVEKAQEEAQAVVKRYDVSTSIAYDMISPTEAVIGVVPHTPHGNRLQSAEDYLDHKAAHPKEGIGWMKKAVAKVFPG